MKYLSPNFVLAMALPLTSLAAVAEAPVAGTNYNVVWTTPSKDSLDSMPLSGRGGTGANVWVQDGSLWLYLAHNGAYDEQGRLLKLGCVRITPTASPLGKAADFRQELDPATGTLTLREGGFAACLWFAGETLLIEVKSSQAQALDVAFGTWRDKPRAKLKLDVWGEANVQADQVTADESGLVWFHRNADAGFDLTELARQQGIEAAAIHDCTSKRVFGGAVTALGGWSKPVESAVQWQSWEGKAWSARTGSRDTHALAIALRAQQNGNPAQWLAEAAAAMVPAALQAAKTEDSRLWADFGARSHIVINPTAGPDDAGWRVGRNYQLFRYMLACNRDGELPLLFNGGIFTTDNLPGRITGNNNNELPISAGPPTTPDFRRWMGCGFMAQNQRWLGWPTLAAGDTDLLAPSLKFYRERAATATARARAQGAEGMVYTEPLDIWGLCCVDPRPDGLCGAPHLTYHFSMMLEHAWMALGARAMLGARDSTNLRWVQGVVLFYDSFYRAACKKRTGKETGDDGKLVIFPSNGLEYAGGATNPAEVVAGLTRVTVALLDLPELPASWRIRLQDIYARLPDLPIGMRDGKRSVLPAQSFQQEHYKWELAEMYPAWPYRMMGVTRPDTLQLARDTWDSVPAGRARLCRQDYSWMANLANMAALGLPDAAQQRAIYKLANTSAPQARFPAFFGPGHDWLPDHNWGGSAMTGLQEMLLAADPYGDGKIHLLAAWPQAWDVDFKLHAPQQTVVEASVKHGKLITLKVTPESRRRDVVLNPLFAQ
jgi:hypothetical protein